MTAVTTKHGLSYMMNTSSNCDSGATGHIYCTESGDTAHARAGSMVFSEAFCSYIVGGQAYYMYCESLF